jgi:hypothetical protein
MKQLTTRELQLNLGKLKTEDTPIIITKHKKDMFVLESMERLIELESLEQLNNELLEKYLPLPELLRAINMELAKHQTNLEYVCRQYSEVMIENPPTDEQQEGRRHANSGWVKGNLEEMFDRVNMNEAGREMMRQMADKMKY